VSGIPTPCYYGFWVYIIADHLNTINIGFVLMTSIIMVVEHENLQLLNLFQLYGINLTQKEVTTLED
jgi:hypothetical protein